MSQVGSQIIGGLVLLAGGYALTYYGVNVLIWAHSSALPASDPVPLSHLIGLPDDTAPASAAFMPPFQLGSAIVDGTGVAVGITDARGLLGGTATTGVYSTATAGPGGTGPAAVTATPGGTADLGAQPGGPSAIPSGNNASGTGAGVTNSSGINGADTPSINGSNATGAYVQNGYEQLSTGQWVPVTTPESVRASHGG